MSSPRVAALAGCVGIALVSAFAGVRPAAADTARRFVHTTEADFEPGEAEGFAVTAYGELVPVPAFEELPAPPEGVETLLALATADGVPLAVGGTATGGFQVLALRNDAWEVDLEEPDAQAFCLLVLDGETYVGISAADGGSRIARVESGDEPASLRTAVALPDDRYVWDLAGGTDGVPLLIATGTEGRVLRVDAEALAAATPEEPAEPAVVLDSAQANVLTLAASPGGFPVYAGTDTDGIVYRIEAHDQDGPEGGPLAAVAFFDAPEPEIAALAVAADGRVYAGTADAEQARPGRLNDAASESTGRPDVADEDLGASNDADAPPPEPAPVELAEDGTPEPTPAPAPAPAPGAVAPANSRTQRPEAAEEAPSTDPPAVEEAAEGDGEAEGEPDAPTPADYDALRKTLETKLAEAKKTGKLEIEGVAAASAAPKASRPRTADQPEAEKKEGNAVYELLADGSFREVFREASMVLSLALEPGDGSLLVATGNEGELQAVDLGSGTATLVRDLESQQVTALLGTGDGLDGTLVAASNPAAAGRLPRSGGDARPTGEAVYTSPTLDAGRRALFGRIGLVATGPQAASLLVETRSGETFDPASAPWGDWAEAGRLAPGETGRTLEIPSPPARFLQYRLTLPAGASGDAPLAIEEVTLSYAVPNLGPRIARLTLEAAEPGDDGEPAGPTVAVAWEASDPDGDELVFDVDWRLAGSERWLSAAEAVTGTSFDWNTRGLADGLYTVRLTASDERANPPGSERESKRLSEPFRLDQTAPTLTAEAGAAADDGSPRITGTATDATGTVAGVAFRVNDDEAFRPVGAADLLFDSAEEAFELPLPGLAPGKPHVVTLRATDARGNASFSSVVIPAR